MSASPSWAVVGTMDEPSALILSWIAHHLSVGAREVHVYLDQPNPQVWEAAKGVDRVHLTLCDESYWAASSPRARPIRHSARQAHNAQRAIAESGADWVLHCDADEFLQPTAAFAGDLSSAGGRPVVLPILERVHLLPETHRSLTSVFSGAFRGESPRRPHTDRIYGRWADFLENGMASAPSSKRLVPSGAQQDEGARDAARLASARILHFDGLTPLHRVLKLLKRNSDPKYQMQRSFGPQRERQFRMAQQLVAKPVQMRKMLDGVFGLTPGQAQALGDSFVDDGFDPVPALQALGWSADLSEAAIDADLRVREADVIARTGLRF